MAVNKKGFMVLRALLAVWIGIGGLVMLVVLHPMIASLVATFKLGTTDPMQLFAVSMIEVFYVLMLFVGVIVTLVTGE